MKKYNIFIIFMVCFIMVLILNTKNSFSFEKIINVPAEKPEGILLDLEPGNYEAILKGGGITLFYPINPNFSWLYSVSIGSDVDGGEDEPDIGVLYFEPNPKSFTQADAEKQLIAAIHDIYLNFNIKEHTMIRFWVSDFDYTDNSGMIKLLIKKK